MHNQVNNTPIRNIKLGCDMVLFMTYCYELLPESNLNNIFLKRDLFHTDLSKLDYIATKLIYVKFQKQTPNLHC